MAIVHRPLPSLAAASYSISVVGRFASIAFGSGSAANRPYTLNAVAVDGGDDTANSFQVRAGWRSDDDDLRLSSDTYQTYVVPAFQPATLEARISTESNMGQATDRGADAEVIGVWYGLTHITLS